MLPNILYATGKKKLNGLSEYLSTAKKMLKGTENAHNFTLKVAYLEMYMNFSYTYIKINVMYNLDEAAMQCTNHMFY